MSHTMQLNGENRAIEVLRMTISRTSVLVATILLLGSPLFTSLSKAAEPFITLASTTSTENSGLLSHVVPQFTEATGIHVRVVALGTGQAMRLARAGDADVLLVHHRASEEAFVSDGFGVARHEVMYNDFVIIGPQDDPAGIAGDGSVKEAFKAIAENQALFASRGDDSGTHKAELALWLGAGVELDQASSAWYRELGSGMGATLVTSVALGAYTLSDRATWTSFANKDSHAILVEGDPLLFNQYAVILINPDRHPHTKAEEGQKFIDWLLSNEGQAAIGSFEIDGQQLFFPNAGGTAGN